ncbi:MAG: regulatory protein [Candidatus Magnetoglobus multicellularis str. Araruama]|uniref:Regulatory protein n=2 Tax=Candidatus Magnetoglobus multicellularis TaxID=418099 RepID=F4ZYT1_9BACT|nr:regulatory protein [Candidatus Magnetoglobus multicellularis]ETR64726.1 MAG: regulatory protein [Candidatus Magnetoglobus multicellularis str. Araruama]
MRKLNDKRSDYIQKQIQEFDKKDVYQKNQKPEKHDHCNVAQLENQVEKLSNKMKESNTAFEKLYKQVEIDRQLLQENLIFNIKLLIEPHLERLKITDLSLEQKKYLEIIEANLKNIVSPMNIRLVSQYYQLTPMETQIINLVKIGKTTQEIADLMYLSDKTISTHRNNIRKKLGLINSKVPLRTYLFQIEESKDLFREAIKKCQKS